MAASVLQYAIGSAKNSCLLLCFCQPLAALSSLFFWDELLSYTPPFPFSSESFLQCRQGSRRGKITAVPSSMLQYQRGWHAAECMTAICLWKVGNDCLLGLGVPDRPRVAFPMILQWLLSFLQLLWKFPNQITLCSSHGPARHFDQVFLYP